MGSARPLGRRRRRSRGRVSAIVHLVRHGHHDELGAVLSGRSAIRLSATGRAEARALASRLARREVGSVHASPRSRTMETAAVLAAPHALVPAAVAALDEVEFGEWTGRSFAELAGDARWDEWNRNRSGARAPGGESMSEAVARARAHIDQLETDKGEIVCVTHCDIIRGLVADWLGLSLDRLLDLPCPPGSLTSIALGQGTPRLLSIAA